MCCCAFPNHIYFTENIAYEYTNNVITKNIINVSTLLLLVTCITLLAISIVELFYVIRQPFLEFKSELIILLCALELFLR